MKKALVFGVLAAVTALPVFSEAIIWRDDIGDQAYIDYGTQHQAVAAVLTDTGALGTATLIAPQWILTAAHVVWDASNVLVVFDDSATSLVDGIELHMPDPTYTVDKILEGNDLALVKLSEPITDIEPLNLLNGSAMGHDMVGVGYGLNGAGSVGVDPGDAGAWDGVRRAGTNVVDDIFRMGGQDFDKFYAMDFDDNTDANNLMGSKEWTSLEFGGAPGDSGGPLLVEQDGQLRVGGVASFIEGVPNGNNYGFYGWQTGYNSILHHQQWINDTAGVPEPATMVLVGLAGIAALRRKRRSQ